MEHTGNGTRLKQRRRRARSAPPTREVEASIDRALAQRRGANPSYAAIAAIAVAGIGAQAGSPS